MYYTDVHMDEIHFYLSMHLPLPLFCRRRLSFQALKFDSSKQISEETFSI